MMTLCLGTEKWTWPIACLQSKIPEQKVGQHEKAVEISRERNETLSKEK
jgi:hypothetical protein